MIRWINRHRDVYSIVVIVASMVLGAFMMHWLST